MHASKSYQSFLSVLEIRLRTIWNDMWLFMKFDVSMAAVRWHALFGILNFPVFNEKKIEIYWSNV